MDLQQEIKELKAMLSQIINMVQKPTEPTPEEVVAMRQDLEKSCAEHNLANAQGESPLPSLDVSVVSD